MGNIDKVEVSALAEDAVIIELGTSISFETHRKVKALTTYLDEHPFQGMIETIPAFTTVTVLYNPLQVSYAVVKSIIKQIVSDVKINLEDKPKMIEIPVCYGGEFGPDLEDVAKHNGLTAEEVIHIHCSSEYLVYMIGFAPGFPYLGEMSERIAAPRRQTPRLVIPAGSVGIAGGQTGIYPIETPGGWQLIGRTPLPLFRPKEKIPSLLQSGNVIKFKPISKEEYLHSKEENA